jgi:hypothetical protein
MSMIAGAVARFVGVNSGRRSFDNLYGFAGANRPQRVINRMAP